MAKRRKNNWDNLEPQKSSAAQFLTYVASVGQVDVKHYDLRIIIALGFKIDNEKAIAFRKWANQIVSEFEKYRIVQDRLFMSDYDRYLIALEEEIKKNDSGGDRG